MSIILHIHRFICPSRYVLIFARVNTNVGGLDLCFYDYIWVAVNIHWFVFKYSYFCYCCFYFYTTFLQLYSPAFFEYIYLLIIYHMKFFLSWFLLFHNVFVNYLLSPFFNFNLCFAFRILRRTNLPEENQEIY